MLCFNVKRLPLSNATEIKLVRTHVGQVTTIHVFAFHLRVSVKSFWPVFPALVRFHYNVESTSIVDSSEY